MADYEYELTKLSVTVSNNRDAAALLTLVVEWTVADETYKVTLPATPHDQIRQTLARLSYAVSSDQLASKLAGGDSFTVDLIE